MGNTTDKTIQTFEQIKIKAVDFLTDYGFAVVGATIILVIGLIIAWWVGRVLKKWLESKRIEPSIVMLAVRVIRLIVFLVALLQALETLHVHTGPALAFMGVAGVGIGLALQGVLGNMVAGLVIIFSKPFRVGEYIEVAGVSGQVKHIELFSTMLLHADRSHVMIPNRKLVGEIMHNYGQIRQLDLGVGVGYGTNMDGALKIVREILAANARVLKEPAPFVGISSLGDFSIQITIKPWTKVPDYGLAQVEIYEAILNQFRANKIEIPFPQREVRMLNSV
jgi:small conductance mechanosensitive channel